MNEYIKWLPIGFLIGAGIYAGESSLDYVYTRHIQPLLVTNDEYLNVTDFSKINIAEQRLVNEGRQYKVVGFITNTSGHSYYSVVVESLIYDKEGLVDVCTETIVKLKSGSQAVEATCSFFNEPDSSRFLHSTMIKDALRIERS